MKSVPSSDPRIVSKTSVCPTYRRAPVISFSARAVSHPFQPHLISRQSHISPWLSSSICPSATQHRQRKANVSVGTQNFLLTDGSWLSLLRRDTPRLSQTTSVSSSQRRPNVSSSPLVSLRVPLARSLVLFRSFFFFFPRTCVKMSISPRQDVTRPVAPKGRLGIEGRTNWFWFYSKSFRVFSSNGSWSESGSGEERRGRRLVLSLGLSEPVKPTTTHSDARWLSDQSKLYLLNRRGNDVSADSIRKRCGVQISRI